MGLVLNNCDEINVLNFGELIASGPPSIIQSNEEVRRAYLGGTAVAMEQEGSNDTTP